MPDLRRLSCTQYFCGRSAPGGKVGLGGGQAEMSRGGLWLMLLFHSSSMESKLSANLLTACLMKGLLDLNRFWY